MNGRWYISRSVMWGGKQERVWISDGTREAGWFKGMAAAQAECDRRNAALVGAPA